MPRIAAYQTKYQLRDDCDLINSGLKRQKISQATAAAELNMTQPALSYKLKHDPTYGEMLKLCELLGWKIKIIREE